MKFARISLALLVLASASAPSVHAQTKTREEVKAEWAEAIRTGDVLATGDIGLKLNQLHPDLYAKPAPTMGASREMVKAALREAIRTGDMVASGQSGMKLNEIETQRYPARAVALGKTREQVKVETLEAIRTGDIVAAGESSQTLNERYPQLYVQARDLYTAQTGVTPPRAASVTQR